MAANIKQQKQNANGRTTSKEQCQSKQKPTLSIFTPLQLHSKTTIQHLSSGKLPLAICVPRFWLHSWCFSTRASRSRRRAFTCCKQKYKNKNNKKIASAVYYQFAKERRQQLNKCFDHATASSPRDSNDSQGPEPLSGSRGLPHSCAHCRTYKCSGTHHYDFGNFNTGGMSRHKLTIAESNPETRNSYHNEHFASAQTVLLMTIMCQWWHCEQPLDQGTTDSSNYCVSCLWCTKDFHCMLWLYCLWPLCPQVCP